jgi:6-phosphogluconolactonase/glucosamine-6-phosphate isomerase/deaminase
MPAIIKATDATFGYVAAGVVMQATFGGAVPGLPPPCVVFATGGTQEPMHAALAEMHGGRFANARITHLDEYVFGARVPQDVVTRLSYARTIRDKVVIPLLGRRKASGPNVHLMDTSWPSIDTTAAHDQFIRDSGGVTTVILGVGRGPTWNDLSPRRLADRFASTQYSCNRGSGSVVDIAVRMVPSIHLAFDEAMSVENAGVFTESAAALLASRAHDISAHAYLHPDSVPFRMGAFVTDLHPATIETNGLSQYGITQAVTMSLGAILCARNIILLARGGEKALSLFLALRGPVTPLVPASALQLVRHRLTVVADAAALRFFP